MAKGSLTLVIVGYGHAGRGLVDDLHQRGTAGWRRILVLDQDAGGPRPAGSSAHGASIEVHHGARVTAIDTARRCLAAGGVVISYDALVLASGARSALDLAAAAGLVCGPGGIAVDREGRTSAVGVHAVGSCADGGDPGATAAALAALVEHSGDPVAAFPCLAPASPSDLLSLLVESAALASV